MKNLKWMILVLAGLAAVYGLLQLTNARKTKARPLFPAFKAEAASKITVHAPDARTVLEKQGDVWVVTSEASYPAAADAVQKMLDAVASFSTKDVISSDPGKQALYQVDSTGVAVTMSDAAGKTLAAFVVGKMGPDYESNYVRDANSNYVILAQGYLGSTFSRGKGSWQDKRIFAFEPTDIVEVTVAKPGFATVLTRDEAGTWKITEPAGAACDAAKANRLVRSLARLTADDFAGHAPMPEAGVENPDSSISFKTTGGAREKLLVGHASADGRFYAARAGGSVVYFIAPRLVTALLPDAAGLAPAAASQPGQPDQAGQAGSAGAAPPKSGEPAPAGR